MAMSIIEDIEQEEREQEKDSFGEDDDDELFDDDCAQKCAGYPPPWRTDRCDFSRRRKIYTEFIIIDTFGSGSAFEKRKVALLSKQDCLNNRSKCCSRRFSQLRIAGSSTPFLRHFRVGMRRVIGTYVFWLHPKMPVISGLISICAFAESFRNRLTFDDT